MEFKADVLVAGGGVGGVAAALGATSMGFHVVLTEEYPWLGGQLTSQAVPPDENGWIENHGCTRRYRAFRNGVRDYYRAHYPLLPSSRANPHLNPGAGHVSAVCHEFRVGAAVIEGMLAPERLAGRLTILPRRRPVFAVASGDRLGAVAFRDLETGESDTVTASMVLDATELGDLLPLAGAEYVAGAESRDETGEPHAVAGPAQPGNSQSFTWCFPMAWDPDGNRVIDKPEQWERWRDYVPKLTPAWPGKLLDWTHAEPVDLRAWKRCLFPWETKDIWEPLWTYRRIAAKEHYPEGFLPHEVTLVNWPQNDYWEGDIIDQHEDTVTRRLKESRQLSLSLLYWLQTEAPRPDGGRGYPGLHLRPDIAGTGDGLAQAPYIRESRRIRAVFTVTENHVGAEARGKKPAEEFPDSVGIGCYRIDLHPSAGGTNYIDISSKPFRIPLGALIPVRMENLLPACKNLGVTHITNGCYRLHPVEWNIGEAAGLLAAFSLSRKVPPRAVREDAELLKEFQGLLVDQGFELAWPDEIAKKEV